MEWKKRGNALTVNEILSMRDLAEPDIPPFVKNLHEAVNLTKKEIRAGKPITIVGDYDCDGITSSAILKYAITGYIDLLGLDNKLTVIIPDRYKEGYGLNMAIVDRIPTGLMITIDNGIAAVEQVEAAKAKGLTVVVIDHHLKRDDGRIPDADVLVDPHVEMGEFEDYCGAGLAYRFAMELIPDTKIEPHLMALAGIGTVADVMPLVGDNRRMVKEALKHLADRNVSVGLNALLDVLGADSHIDEGFIGFHIGPCFNAMGRLRGDGGIWMVNLLTSELTPDLMSRAYEVVTVNDKRQKLTLDCMELTETLLTSTYPVIIVEDSTMFIKGIVGIIAGRLCEKYKVPAIVFTEDTKNPNNLTGSGRAPEGVHLKKLLDSVSDYLVGYGGHAGAAGLTIEKKNLDAFKSAIAKQLEGYSPTVDVEEYDLETDILDIPQRLAELKAGAPYGEGNPEIVFRVNGIKGLPKIIGKFQNHFRLQAPDVTVLGFDMVENWKNEDCPNCMDVLGTLGVNHFKDKDEYQIRLVDFHPVVEKKTETYNDLASMFSF